MTAPLYSKSSLTNHKSSRIPGFYERPLPERLALVAQWAGLDASEQSALLGMNGLNATQADKMVENAIGVYALPLGIAVNFTINRTDYLIPMAIEEPSVIAAVSYAAKLARVEGGFTTTSDEPIMIGQLQILKVDNVYAAAGRLWDARTALIEAANDPSSSIIQRGGGARGLEFHPYPDSPVGPMLVVHLLFDVRDAMGANAVNTACERIAPMVETISGGQVNLRILSNLTDHRRATASCRIPADAVGGTAVVERIVEAGAFAEIDPHRAATHNKGILNGMDAVCIATGNDWRALEAGAHAYAARSGRYRSLTRWTSDPDGALRGEIDVPLAVGLVGGATRVHPSAKIALKILGVSTARQLAEVIVAVGLAQNLAAIRALATEGIQRGHMSLHARQLAAAAGASGAQIDQISAQMVAENNIRLDYAKTLLARETPPKPVA